MAAPSTSPFPQISFHDFSTFISNNFGTNITLATALVLFFSITDNPDLINLHARQQNPEVRGEKSIHLTGWMKHLSKSLLERLKSEKATLFHPNEYAVSEDQKINSLATKLDDLAKSLPFPYADNKFQGNLMPISHKEIEPVLVICPISVVCEDIRCQERALFLETRDRDIPQVTLIKGTHVYKNVSVLKGQCSECKTVYYADHESIPHPSSETTQLYLNNAQYLKVGQSTWVDRIFSNAVISGTYSFHASAAAYTEFWNNSFGHQGFELTRRQTWQSFVQESVRAIATESDTNLELKKSLKIEHVTEQAFQILGNDGLVESAKNHSCSDCTHEFKAEQDTYPDQVHDYDPSVAPVSMVVVDGIVMGPTHCAFDGRSQELASARGGAFCLYHENTFGNKCRV